MGADCVTKLRGMFALAIYDKVKRKLVLARDRLGKKPLHYAQVGNKLCSGLTGHYSVPLRCKAVWKSGANRPWSTRFKREGG